MNKLYNFLKQHKDFGEEVLSVKSPRRRVDGPYEIVKTDIDMQYAIVTLLWDGNPALGIRWFDEFPGMPSSHGYRTWFIIPEDLWEAVISTLEPEMQKYVKRFLKIDEHTSTVIEGHFPPLTKTITLKLKCKKCGREFTVGPFLVPTPDFGADNNTDSTRQEEYDFCCECDESCDCKKNYTINIYSGMYDGYFDIDDDGELELLEVILQSEED